MTEAFNKLPEEKQTAIINACLDEFIEHDYDNVSTNRIVKSAGISKGSLFKYFTNKENMYFLIIDYTVSIIYEHIVKRYKPNLELDFLDRFMEYFDRTFDYFFINPRLFLFYLKTDFWKGDIMDRIMVKYMPIVNEVMSKMFMGIDESKLRWDTQKCFQFMKWTIWGFKYDFFSDAQKKSGDPEKFKNEFRIQFVEITEFLRAALFKPEC